MTVSYTKMQLLLIFIDMLNKGIIEENQKISKKRKNTMMIKQKRICIRRDLRFVSRRAQEWCKSLMSIVATEGSRVLSIKNLS